MSIIITITTEDGKVLEKHRVWTTQEGGKPVPPGQLANELMDFVTFWFQHEKVPS